MRKEILMALIIMSVLVVGCTTVESETVYEFEVDGFNSLEVILTFEDSYFRDLAYDSYDSYVEEDVDFDYDKVGNNKLVTRTNVLKESDAKHFSFERTGFWVKRSFNVVTQNAFDDFDDEFVEMKETTTIIMPGKVTGYSDNCELVEDNMVSCVAVTGKSNKVQSSCWFC